jgi:membrane protein DedA with SNARE-associated domain
MHLIMHLLRLLDLQHVQGWIIWGGYFLLFILLFSCGVGLPLPEDIPLLLAGYFVAQPEGTPGKMHLLPAAIIAWCGIIGGDCMLYSFGRKYGLNVTRLPLIGRHVTEDRIVKAEKLFERWGGLVVGVGRMLAGVRGAMVVAAGAIRYRFEKFLLADGLGAIVSGGLFLTIGYFAGKKLGNLDEVRQRIEHFEFLVLLCLGLIVASCLAYLLMHRRKHGGADVALATAIPKSERAEKSG